MYSIFLFLFLFFLACVELVRKSAGMKMPADRGDGRDYAQRLALKWLFGGVHEPPPKRISVRFCASASCSQGSECLVASNPASR